MFVINRRTVGVFVLVLAGLGFGACKKTDPSAQPGAALSAAPAPGDSVAAASDGPAPENEKDEQLSEKVNQYVECLNGLSDSVQRSHDRYLYWADEKKGPTMNYASLGLYKINDADRCKQALAKAKTLPPPLPDFDAVIAPYEQATAELLPLIDQAYKYYDEGNYKDDKLAKGKQMHAPLLAAFAKFQDASKAFDAKVTQLNDGLSQRRLARLAKDPKDRLHYLIEKTEIDAKTLVRASEVKSLSELDLSTYTTVFDTYDKTLTDLESYVSEHKQEADHVSMLSTFLDSAKDYMKSTKELLRRKRDNKDFQKFSGSATSVDGHPAQIMEKYNRFIGYSNNLRTR